MSGTYLSFAQEPIFFGEIVLDGSNLKGMVGWFVGCFGRRNRESVLQMPRLLGSNVLQNVIFYNWETK